MITTCATCSASLPEASRFCPSCGTSTSPSSDVPTQLAGDGRGPGWGTARPEARPSAAPPRSAPARGVTGISSTSDPHGQARFIPGAVIADRYRVIGLLGRGGMGEVYRADDLKLGQAVALKFLPESLAADPGRLQRFYNEAKVARQVSHSNVCRVHDIDEYEGHPFISMEYIDGEDLSSLLRRIGRLPGEKAVQIARQICAGLAAAHERGILHRDLKPANVLLDGRGHAHLTDFGLARLAQEIAGPEVRAGTPAYMAPEQLAGKEVTVRSDLYSLGLTLYELFTGKVAFEARSTEELIRLQTDTTPASPSRLVEGLDPSVERVILRCLERDPAVRPASALAVAAALPGGDQLAAALAAGETPSPQMVADAGEEGALRPATALVFAAIVLAGIALQAFTAEGRHAIHRVPTPRSPEVLAAGARDLIFSLGYGEAPADSAWGFTLDEDLVREIREKDSGIDRWDRLGTARPAAYSFWYRQSPRVLVPRRLNVTISPSDPPAVVSGMINVEMDPQGRLVSFTAVPPQRDDRAAESADPPDWAPLFAAAGLEVGSFREAPPQWNPLINCQEQAAWEGSAPEDPGMPLRVEACSYRSRPAWFTIVPAWRRPHLLEQDEATGLEDLVVYGILGFVLIVLGTAGYLAWRSQRLGRSDRKGGFRLAAYLFSVLILADLVRVLLLRPDPLWLPGGRLHGIFRAALRPLSHLVRLLHLLLGHRLHGLAPRGRSRALRVPHLARRSPPPCRLPPARLTAALGHVELRTLLPEYRSRRAFPPATRPGLSISSESGYNSHLREVRNRRSGLPHGG